MTPPGELKRRLEKRVEKSEQSPSSYVLVVEGPDWTATFKRGEPWHRVDYFLNPSGGLTVDLAMYHDGPQGSDVAKQARRYYAAHTIQGFTVEEEYPQLPDPEIRVRLPVAVCAGHPLTQSNPLLAAWDAAEHPLLLDYDAARVVGHTVRGSAHYANSVLYVDAAVTDRATVRVLQTLADGENVYADSNVAALVTGGYNVRAVTLLRKLTHPGTPVHPITILKGDPHGT